MGTITAVFNGNGEKDGGNTAGVVIKFAVYLQ